MKTKEKRDLDGCLAGDARAKTFRSCYVARQVFAASQKNSGAKWFASGTAAARQVHDQAFLSWRAHLKEGSQNLKRSPWRAPILHVVACRNSFISVTRIGTAYIFRRHCAPPAASAFWCRTHAGSGGGMEASGALTSLRTNCVRASQPLLICLDGARRFFSAAGTRFGMVASVKLGRRGDQVAAPWNECEGKGTGSRQAFDFAGLDENDSYCQLNGAK
ncbi:hypothetical protein [Cupriavidus neocaledonicus]|uniref:hypothetical protein n=1 Tax=Cupriavidus neocaledonicus TaxID=1040979 RepID=UPI0011C0270E|nr:hypothetical protein [Cupriavidus neocaledonicus]